MIYNYEGSDAARPECLSMWGHDSSVRFSVDGDASGGKYYFYLEEIKDDEERGLLNYQQAQNYNALGDIVGGGPHVCLGSSRAKEDWYNLPPYAEGGGASFGEQPTLSVTEFYVTPFDRLIQDSPAESVVSALSPGTLIGFILSIADLDEEGELWKGHLFISGQDEWPGIFNADDFARGLLVGPGGEIPDSAVESVTWGRLKATVVRCGARPAVGHY